MNSQLKEFAKKHSWEHQMNTSKGLDSWSNYGGPNLGNLVVVIGQNRDSELLEESNFESALDMLGGKSKDVIVERFGHWGCGWFELILVNPKNKAKLQIAYDIHKLLEQYPVLDDSDYSDRQSEKFSDYADGAKQDLAEALCLHFGLPEKFSKSEDMLYLAYALNIKAQYYYGEDACVDVYDCREPDDRDLKRLETIMQQLEYSLEDNQAFQYLAACLGIGE
jgi:hypothetical protein